MTTITAPGILFDDMLTALRRAAIAALFEGSDAEYISIEVDRFGDMQVLAVTDKNGKPVNLRDTGGERDEHGDSILLLPLKQVAGSRAIGLRPFHVPYERLAGVQRVGHYMGYGAGDIDGDLYVFRRPVA